MEKTVPEVDLERFPVSAIPGLSTPEAALVESTAQSPSPPLRAFTSSPAQEFAHSSPLREISPPKEDHSTIPLPFPEWINVDDPLKDLDI